VADRPLRARPSRATIPPVIRLPVPSPRLVAALACLALALGACSPSVTPAPSVSPTPPAPSPSAAASSSAGVSPPAGPSGGPSASTGADLVALTARISTEVSQIRGLSIESPVHPQVVTETQAKDLLRQQFEAENGPSYIAAEEGLYKRLGLLASSASLEDLELQLLDSQVLGFYVPKDKTLYVVARSGGVGPTEQYTMAHEITHALQDQHFDLQKVSPDALDQTDATIGAHSIIEGDASLAGTLWATRHLSAQDLATIVAAGADPTQQAVLATMPAIVRDPLLFLYTQGLQLTLGLFQSGGWAAVDRALQSPPLSSEQVLHPAKYASGERPVAVALPADLAANLGSGWKLALQDTLGELELRIWLQSSTSSASLADQAAAGWGGDRVGYLTGPAGQDAVIMWTAWDSATDAAEFLDAAGRLVSGGTSPGTVIRASDREVVVVVASERPLVDTVAKAAGLPR
jgi:hypothetical protein